MVFFMLFFVSTRSVAQPLTPRAEAMVMVNSASAEYADFQHFLQPYLNQFGIPYTLLDIATTPVETNIEEYALIIIGHRQFDTDGLYLDLSEQSNITHAVSEGTGLVNFDNDLSADGATPRYAFVDDVFDFGYTTAPTASGITISTEEDSDIRINCWADDHQSPVLTTTENSSDLAADDGKWTEFLYTASRPYPNVTAGVDEDTLGLPVMRFYSGGISNGDYEVVANLYTAVDMRYFYGFTPSDPRTHSVDTVGGAGGSEQHAEYSLGTVSITNGTFNIYVQDAELTGSGTFPYFGWSSIRLVEPTDSQYAEHVLSYSNDLLAYYPFDETSGTTADNAEGTSGYDGTVLGTTTLGVSAPRTADGFAGLGTANTSFDFDGAAGYVDISAARSALDLETMTFSAMVRMDGTDLRILDTGASGISYPLTIQKWDIGGEDKVIVVLHGGTTTTGQQFGSGVLNDGNWHHLVVTRDGVDVTSDIAVYMDGAVLAKTGVGEGSIDSTSTTRIGSRVDGSQWTDGGIDEVAFFSRALSASDVTNLYNAATQGAPSHYITERHEVNETIDTGSMTLAGISLPSDVTFLAHTGNDPFLAVTTHGAGRAVQWATYDWMSHAVHGPVYKLDDLLWRSLVWAARKPFVMQGMPHFLTMRIDDDSGPFDWIEIANEFGFTPWTGVFIDDINAIEAVQLSALVHSNRATASIHAFDYDNGFYYDLQQHEPWSDEVMATNFAKGTQWHLTNNIPRSKFVVPHYGEIGVNAFQGLIDWGTEFIVTFMIPGYRYRTNVPWLMLGPYRLYESGDCNEKAVPLYYADFLPIPEHPEFNNEIFVCVTEGRDIADYEWGLTGDIPLSIERGTLQAKRGLDSMTLPTLFTHKQRIDNITGAAWREILAEITGNLESYDPIYVTYEYGAQYARAMVTSEIANSIYDPDLNQLTTTVGGSADMDTLFYLFTEQDGEIIDTMVEVPSFSQSTQVVTSLSGTPQMFTLTLSADSGGSVTPESGFYVAGHSVDIAATSDTYYHFAQWSGDTGAITTGTADDATVTVTMSSTVGLAANFVADETSGGTPHAWLAQQDPAWTNDFEAAATNDADGDTVVTGDEYISGTSPTNAASVFDGTSTVVEGDAIINLPTVPSDIDGKLRRYGIKTTTNLNSSWSWVPGYGSILGQGQTVIYTNTFDSTLFIRVQVWLE